MLRERDLLSQVLDDIKVLFLNIRTEARIHELCRESKVVQTHSEETMDTGKFASSSLDVI